MVVLVEVHLPEPLVPPGGLAAGAGLAGDAAAHVLDYVGSLPLERGEGGVLGVHDEDAEGVLGFEYLEEGVQHEPVLAPVVVDAYGLGGYEDEGLHLVVSRGVADHVAGEEGETVLGYLPKQLELLHDLGEGVLDVLAGGLGFDVDCGAVLVSEVLHDVVDLFGGGYVDRHQFGASAL